MFLSNVKIGTKLFLAFGFFIVLMVSASLSLFSLNRANTGMQSIITSDYPTTVKANQLIDNFQEFIGTQQLMLLDEQGAYTAQSQQRLKEISEHITVILGELNNALHDEKSQQVLADIRGVRQQYLDSRYRILQAVQNNDRAGAIREMMTNTLNLQQAYKAKVQALIEIQNNEMQSAGTQVDGDFRTSRLLLILITLFSVVAGSLIGWFIVRDYPSAGPGREFCTGHCRWRSDRQHDVAR
jgi:methyl-accepting chemotaxis protein-2 (aspartate sensor receptor)